MGYNHFDRKSASRMATFISDEMHKTLIQHIVAKHSPVSIILDTSTDVGQNHYLIVYFQALENGFPVVYFYKLIKLDADETSAALFGKLIETWNNEQHAFTQHL